MPPKAQADQHGSPASAANVRAVERSLAILDAFSLERPELSLDEISEEVKLPKTTAHRLVQTLVASGFVERGNRHGSYRLSLVSARLGAIATHNRTDEAIQDALVTLRKQTGETVGLAVLDRGAAVIVNRLVSHQPLRYDIRVGSRLPGYCASSGRVLLAALDDDAVRVLYEAGELDGEAHMPLPPLDELLALLDEVRRQGFALDDEQYAEGLRCISVPVVDPGGTTRYALGVSSVAARLSSTDLIETAPALRVAARSISTCLSTE